VGANLYTGLKDSIFKKRLNDADIIFFYIHGNHEMRPETIPSYKIKTWNEGEVYFEEEYPNLLFAMDGEVYNIDGKKTIVIGGAYSVDKYSRAYYAALIAPFFFKDEEITVLSQVVKMGCSKNIDKKLQKKADRIINKTPSLLMSWWKDEQPSTKTKEHCEEVLSEHNWNIDVVLTHTAPVKFEPTEEFIEGLNQDFVDKTTEKWLDSIEEKLQYKLWYAGHYHTNKTVSNSFKFLYKQVMPFAYNLS
jgi:3-oxoacid CoA-transferase subunit A